MGYLIASSLDITAYMLPEDKRHSGGNNVSLLPPRALDLYQKALTVKVLPSYKEVVVLHAQCSKMCTHRLDIPAGGLKGPLQAALQLILCLSGVVLE